MYNENNICSNQYQDINLSENNKIVDTGTTLESCKCPQDTNQVEINAATGCRLINIPIKITNICPKKEFILFVTVYDDKGNKIGQICNVFTTPAGNCNTPIIHKVTLAIKKPVCSNEKIFVDVRGNYTNICDVK